MRWIIGDIHGMLRPLETVLSAIEKQDSDRQLIFVGDYVNRGPESKGVIDLLLSLPSERVHFIRGNHDDVFDQVMSGLSICGKPGEEQRVASFQWFMQHGMDKTFLSYGVTSQELNYTLRRPKSASLDELAAAVPANHRHFIRNLPVVYESDDIFVAHAKWDIYTATNEPTISERLQSSEIVRYTLIWGRYRADEIEAEKPAWQRMGYFGHTPVDSYIDGNVLLPVGGPKIVLLDTAAALVAHGRLSAYCHESGALIQADPQGKLVVPP